jgi:hypothetical protein
VIKPAAASLQRLFHRMYAVQNFHKG